MKDGYKLGFIVACVLAAPSLAADAPAPTAWFKGDVSEVSSIMANACASRAGIVAEQDNYHVLCSKQVSGLKGALAQALIGNSYSTTPEIKARFAIFKDGSSTRVQVSQWIETVMAFGQVRREPMNNKKQNASLQGMLTDAGGLLVRPVDIPSSIETPSPFPPATK